MVGIGDGRFVINANVSATSIFLGWMFKFGDYAEILEPESLREAMRDLIKTGSKIYSE